MLKYIEKKTHAHDGPAWIGYVKESHTGATLYFNGKAFKKIHGGGVLGNYQDVETLEEYWISGAQKDGDDRRHVGSGRVYIEAAALEDYLHLRGLKDARELPAQYEVVEDIEKTDIQKFRELENSGFGKLPVPAGRQTL
jgi:hypothetical protein